jgi:hypothetical protein
MSSRKELYAYQARRYNIIQRIAIRREKNSVETEILDSRFLAICGNSAFLI